MSDTNGGLREDEFDGRPELVKKRGRVILLQRLAVAIVTIYIIGSLTLLVLNAIQASQTRHTLIDCTSPSGKCYQEGQKRQGKVINQLIQSDATTQHIVVLAAACAEEDAIRAEEDRVIRAQMISKCVNDQLIAEGR